MARPTLQTKVRERLHRAAGRRRLRKLAVRTATVLGAAGVAYAVAGFLTLEVSVHATRGGTTPTVPLPDDGRTVVRGVFSVHSGRSHDAFGSLEAVAEAAHTAELDFVFLGDHPPDDRRPDLPEVATTWMDGVLVVPGQELVANDVGRVLAMGLDTTFRGWTGGEASFARLIEERHATAFVVHGRSPKDGERWKSGSVTGIAGWEVFDMSETAKRRLAEPWVLYHVGTLLAGLPLGLGDRSLLHLTRDGFDIPSVSAFDSLRMHGPLTATAGLNHHPKMLLRGRPFPPYEPFFRTFLNHVAVDAPLGDDPAAAEAAVSGAVRAGRVFISLGGAERAAGFRLDALRGGTSVAGMGGRAAFGEGTILRAGWNGPPGGRVAYRILRDGRPVAFVRGRELEWSVPSAGIYRVEVYRYAFRVGSVFAGLRPWIFTNPIELVGLVSPEGQAVATREAGDGTATGPGPGG